MSTDVPDAPDGPPIEAVAGDGAEEGAAGSAGDPENDEAGPADGDPDQAADEDEGPRRRARRERAERRAAQARAEAIEQARREAKRQLRGGPAGRTEPAPRGAVQGLKVVLAVILAVAATVGAGLVLYFTPLMSARNVEVTGVEGEPLAEVLEVARIEPGTPLLQIDTGQVAERVAAIRWVASTRVQRQYPSTLRIIVIARIPVVVKDFPDGPHLFDRDGVDFATAPPPPGLPYLDVDNPSPTDPATMAALRVMTALQPAVAAQVSRVAAPSVASITLTLTDGRTVVWGGSDRTAEKAQKLAALLTQPGHAYDVSSPDLPTVR